MRVVGQSVCAIETTLVYTKGPHECWKPLSSKNPTVYCSRTTDLSNMIPVGLLLWKLVKVRSFDTGCLVPRPGLVNFFDEALQKFRVVTVTDCVCSERSNTARSLHRPGTLDCHS